MEENSCFMVQALRFVQLAATGQRLIRICEVSQKVSKMLSLLSDLVSLGNITYAQCRKPHEIFFKTILC